jgi:hypothetical protein
MLALLLCFTGQALLPPAPSMRVHSCVSSAVGRRALLQDVAVAASAAAAFASARPAAAAMKAPVIDLKAELTYILRVQEACSQEVRLVSTGKYRELQRLNIKRAVGMMLENYDLAGRFNKAASAAPKEQVATAPPPPPSPAASLPVPGLALREQPPIAFSSAQLITAAPTTSAAMSPAAFSARYGCVRMCLPPASCTVHLERICCGTYRWAGGRVGGVGRGLCSSGDGNKSCCAHA